MAATIFDSPEPELTPVTQEQAMFHNPVLTRTAGHKRGGRKTAMIGIPIVVLAVALAGAAYFFTRSPTDSYPVATAESPTPAEMATAPAPPVGPVVNPPAEATPAPAPAPVVAAAQPPAVNPSLAVNPPPKAAPQRRAAVARRARPAASAEDSSADVSASVPAPTPPVIDAPPAPSTQP